MRIRVSALPWGPASGTLRQDAGQAAVPSRGIQGLRRFRLTLSFAAAAIVLMAVATIVANRIIGDDARDNLIRIAEENTARDAENLQSMMRTGQHFSQTIVSGGSSESGNMPGHTQEPLHLTLEFLLGPTGLPGNATALVEGLNIVKLNLFGPDGVLQWSTDSGAIGLTKRESPLFQKALARNVASKLAKSHEVARIDGISRPIDVVYMPLWDTPSGDVIGVMKIYRDVSKDVVAQVHEAKSTVLRTMVVTMGGLFFVLLGFIVVAESQPAPAIEDSVRVPSGSETVLLVDDEPLVGDMAGTFLGEQGYRVLMAGDGVEATRLALERPRDGSDLLLTDVVMPRMSGKALAEIVRERHPDIKVIFMSGYADNTLASYGVSGGQADFLQKPFALNTLAGLAREVLDRAWCPDFEVR